MNHESEQREYAYQWRIEKAETIYLQAISKGVASPLVFVCDLRTHAGKTIAGTTASQQEIECYVRRCEADDLVPTVTLAHSLCDAHMLLNNSSPNRPARYCRCHSLLGAFWYASPG